MQQDDGPFVAMADMFIKNLSMAFSEPPPSFVAKVAESLGPMHELTPPLYGGILGGVGDLQQR